MDIGKKIKEKRVALNMTQDALAQKMNVSRATISSWEVGRTYPDLEAVVCLSEVLEIPLDVLLSKESDVLKKITRDTKMKKHNKIKIRILYGIIVVFILFGAMYVYKNTEYKDVTDPEQIKSIKIVNNQIEVTTDLPKYRSISGYMADSLQQGDDTVEISLYSQIDLSMKNKNKILVDPLGLDDEAVSINDVKYVDFVSNDGNVKTFTLSKSKVKQ